MKKKVLQHLKEDQKTFKREAAEDRKLAKELKKDHPLKKGVGLLIVLKKGKPVKKKKSNKQSMESRYHEHSGEEREMHGYKKPKSPKRSFERFKKEKESPMHERKESAKKKKVEKVMREYETGQLHSGSKKGPKVTSRKQAVAIALSEARKAKKRKK